MPAPPAASNAPAGSPLLPLAIALLAWLACAGALGLQPAGTSPPLPPTALNLALHALLPALAGWLLQAATAAQPPTVRLGKAAALWLSWSVACAILVLLLPARLARPPSWPVEAVLLQQMGLLTGLAAGRFVTAARSARVGAAIATALPWLRAAAVAGTLALLLAPLAAETPLLDPGRGWRANSLPAYAKAVPAQFYGLLKALILWVPLGMLFGFARRGEQLRAWTSTTLLALLLALPLLAATLRAGDLLEIAGAWWGIAFGLWIAARMAMPTTGTVLPASSSAAAPAVAIAQAGAASAAPVLAAASDRPARTALQALAWRLAAVIVVAPTLAWAWGFPRWGPWLAAGLVAYAVLLAHYRHAWLLIVPAALPVLNLAPSTGRIFLDEFDLLLVVTVAMAAWHGRDPRAQPCFSRAFVLAAALFALLYAASLAIGLLPPEPLDANAFASYWSHYNALRVAKGFLWALPLAAMLRWTVAPGSARGARLALAGTLAGLGGVIVVGLWERWLFANLFDLAARYRITATFGSMHTGGSEIEIYLAMALPFAWLAVWKGNAPAMRVAGAALLGLGTYLMALTIARGGILALVVGIAILAVGSWRAQAGRFKGWAPAAVALLLTAAVLAVGLGGRYLQARFSSVDEDWATRAAHWHTALALRDADVSTALLGMGLGRFPATYLYRSGATPPGTYRFATENGESFLRLGGGETLYVAQRVPVAGGQRYTISLRARSQQPKARLGVPVCEKHLLNSFRCRWNAVEVPDDGQWHDYTIVLDSGPVGSGTWPARRPVELFVYNNTPGTTIDVDDVQLREADGRPLIRNGDFAAGADGWFIKTHSHLPWHIKNLWVSLLFEQGWLGLLAFSLLLAAAVLPLLPRLWRGDRIATALLASIGGFLTVAAVGSPFDAPRIALLFFLLLITADHATRLAAAPGRLPNPTAAARAASMPRPVQPDA